MLFVTIVFLILYLVLRYRNQEDKRRSLRAAEQAVEENILEIFGSSGLDNFRKKQVWIGMPQSLIVSFWGEPHNKKRTENEKGVWETWLYEPQSYRYGGVEKYKHNRRIEIYNSFVTEISI